MAGSQTASGQGGRAGSPSAVVIEVKAIACELPAVRAVPLGRWSLAELRDEVITTGLIDQISVSTLWRWLNEDALKPWRHRSWIFPRDPDFAAKAAVVLDLYARRFQGRRLVGFQRRYEQTAVPLDWCFTRADLDDLLRRLDEKEQLTNAA